MDTNLSKLWKTVKNRGAWCAVLCGVSKIQIQLSDWTTSLTDTMIISSHFKGEESAPSPTISGSLKVLPVEHLLGSFKTHLKCKRFNSTEKKKCFEYWLSESFWDILPWRRYQLCSHLVYGTYFMVIYISKIFRHLRTFFRSPMRPLTYRAKVLHFLSFTPSGSSVGPQKTLS